MPLIEIKVFENEFSHQQRTGIIEAVTGVMVSFTGESIRPRKAPGVSEREDRTVCFARGRRPNRPQARSATGVTRRTPT